MSRVKSKGPRRSTEERAAEERGTSLGLVLTHARWLASVSPATHKDKALAILEQAALYLTGDGSRGRRIPEAWAALVGTRRDMPEADGYRRVARALRRASRDRFTSSAREALRAELVTIDPAFANLTDKTIGTAIVAMRAGRVASAVVDVLIEAHALGVDASTLQYQLLPTVANAVRVKIKG